MPRRPKHPPLTALTLLAYTVAAIAAAIGGVTGGGWATLTRWALVVGTVSAVVTIIAGIADLRALRTRTRAANTANVHAGIQIGTAALFVAATLVMLAADGGDVPAPVVVLTLVGYASLLVGAGYGAVAANLYGAGLREETIAPRDAPLAPRGPGDEA